jgi:rhamnosyltransferase
VSPTDEALVSLIIRTKDEERWIHACLSSVFGQTYKNIEVIIVDNGSTDRTLMRAREFPVRVVQIDEFLPGKAINDGIRASTGSILVCLSGHCIPVNKHWLANLVRETTEPGVAGVYGRQEPLSFTSDFDKRDLVTVFGLDRRVQLKDPFFHNANSAFRREVWERIPFDESVTNIEDRVWGQEVLRAGMKIVYEPEASVYHWHGIHHGLNKERARKVALILDSLQPESAKKPHADPEKLRTVAIIPVRGRSRKVNGTTLLDYTVRAARAARLISDVVVATDEEQTAELARSLGARAPFLRPKGLSEEYVDLFDVFRHALDQIEHADGVPDLVVLLQETYPFRSATMLDEMILRVVEEGLDTVVAAHKETRGIWLKEDEEAVLLAEGFMPRQFKRSHAMVGLVGLGCVTHPMFLRTGSVFDGKVGLFEVEHPLSAIQVRSSSMLELTELIGGPWWDKHVGSKPEHT